MTFAVAELPQLPLLLLLKLYVQKSCAAAPAAAVVVRHRVTDDAICFCGLLHLIPALIYLCSNTIYFDVSLGSAVACTAATYL